MPSPITNVSKPFSLDSSQLSTGVFIDLGLAKKGRHHVAFFFNKAIDGTDLHIVEDSKMEYSSEFVQYLIKSPNGLSLGSLFEVNTRKLYFKPDRITLIDSDVTEMVEPCRGNFGGVLVFTDSENSFLAIPENPPINKFMVL